MSNYEDYKHPDKKKRCSVKISRRGGRHDSNERLRVKIRPGSTFEMVHGWPRRLAVTAFSGYRSGVCRTGAA